LLLMDGLGLPRRRGSRRPHLPSAPAPQVSFSTDGTAWDSAPARLGRGGMALARHLAGGDRVRVRLHVLCPGQGRLADALAYCATGELRARGRRRPGRRLLAGRNHSARFLADGTMVALVRNERGGRHGLCRNQPPAPTRPGTGTTAVRLPRGQLHCWARRPDVLRRPRLPQRPTDRLRRV